MNIDTVKLEQVIAMPLDKGSHDSINKGLCIMEAVAYVAGEKWSDHPQCACPIIASFLRSWNDRLPDEERQSLKQYIPLLVGSRGTSEVEAQRSWMMTDWVVRDCTPRWLRRAGMESQASILEAMAPITSSAEFASVRPAILAIREETWPKRQAFREKLKEEIRKQLAGKKFAVAAADAAAAAAAAAAAVADAVAAADAAAAAVAVADAVAAADADGHSYYWAVRDAVYQKIKAIFRAKVADTYAESQASAHALVSRLLAVK